MQPRTSRRNNGAGPAWRPLLSPFVPLLGLSLILVNRRKLPSKFYQYSVLVRPTFDWPFSRYRHRRQLSAFRPHCDLRHIMCRTCRLPFCKHFVRQPTITTTLSYSSPCLGRRSSTSDTDQIPITRLSGAFEFFFGIPLDQTTPDSPRIVEPSSATAAVEEHIAL